MAMAADDMLQQVILAREVIKEGFVGDIGFLDNRGDTGFGDAVLFKQAQGGLGDFVAELGFAPLDTIGFYGLFHILQCMCAYLFGLL